MKKKLHHLIVGLLSLLLGAATTQADTIADATSYFSLTTMEWHIDGDAVIDFHLFSGEPAVPYAMVQTDTAMTENDPRDRSGPNDLWWGEPDSYAAAALPNVLGQAASVSDTITTQASALSNWSDTIWSWGQGQMLYGLMGFNVLSGSGVFNISIDYGLSQSLSVDPVTGYRSRAASRFGLFYVEGPGPENDHFEEGDHRLYRNTIFDDELIIQDSGTLRIAFDISQGDWIHIHASAQSDAVAVSAIAPVPEPGTALLFGLGLLGLALGVRKAKIGKGA